MTDTTTTAVTEPAGAGHDEHHHGLSDMGYIRVAVTLAVITAVEVAWSYLPVWNGATGFKAFIEVAGLLAMMATKFVVVASNFMHLKFDEKILTRLFYSGLLLAVGVYCIALTTFQFWGSQPKGFH